VALHRKENAVVTEILGIITAWDLEGWT